MIRRLRSWWNRRRTPAGPPHKQSFGPIVITPMTYGSDIDEEALALEMRLLYGIDPNNITPLPPRQYIIADDDT